MSCTPGSSGCRVCLRQPKHTELSEGHLPAGAHSSFTPSAVLVSTISRPESRFCDKITSVAQMQAVIKTIESGDALGWKGSDFDHHHHQTLLNLTGSHCWSSCAWSVWRKRTGAGSGRFLWSLSSHSTVPAL